MQMAELSQPEILTDIQKAPMLERLGEWLRDF
jgi:hypothetical protein